ncbi:MAG: hypothetical protein KDD51_04390 [Bdellovibrionales bacterium]|nr:hypothetical protein [Bdellovibrionales bacterium]
MRLWLCALLLSLSVTGFGFSEPKEFFAAETQSVQLRVQGSSEGVLLMKHYKFGNPVFLISTFAAQQVNKTRMLSQGHFFSLYNQVYDLLLKRPESEAPKCDSKVDVTLKEKGHVTRTLAYCMDSLDKESRAQFSNWLINIKERL